MDILVLTLPQVSMCSHCLLLKSVFDFAHAKGTLKTVLIWAEFSLACSNSGVMAGVKLELF